MASLPCPLKNRLDNHGRVSMARMPYPPTDCHSHIYINKYYSTSAERSRSYMILHSSFFTLHFNKYYSTSRERWSRSYMILHSSFFTLHFNKYYSTSRERLSRSYMILHSSFFTLHLNKLCQTTTKLTPREKRRICRENSSLR